MAFMSRSPFKYLFTVLALALVLGFSKSSQPPSKSKVLWQALQAGDYFRAQVSATDGFDPNYEEHHTYLIHLATKMNWPGMVEHLRQHGANLDVKDAEGDTPLHLAAQGQFVEVTRVLVQGGADVNKQSFDTPLIDAIMFDCWGCIQALNTPTLDVNLGNENGVTPLRHAVKKNDMAVVKWLVEEKKADVDAADDERFTPLMQAVLEDSHDMVTYLLSAGANPNLKWDFGGTPLSIAIENSADTVLDLICVTNLDAIQDDDRRIRGRDLISQSRNTQWIAKMENCDSPSSSLD